MAEKAKTSTAVKANTFAAAFLKAQSEFPEIPKDGKADAGLFSYKYGTLPAILRAVLPVLHKNNLALTQLFSGGLIVTKLVHESGEMLSEMECSAGGLKPQDFGSKITYLRRYSLIAMLGISPDDDTDAAGVEAPPPVQPPLAAPQPVDTPASEHAAVATRLIDEKHDLVGAWSVAELKSRGDALRAVGDYLDALEIGSGDDLYTFAVRGMTSAVDSRNA
jgi:hypothetical protein